MREKVSAHVFKYFHHWSLTCWRNNLIDEKLTSLLTKIYDAINQIRILLEATSFC